MKNIGDFLSRFKIIRSPKQNREEVVRIIQGVLKIDITESDIEIKNKIVFIQCHPAIKTAIFLKKEVILEQIKEKLPDVQVVDLK
jgi:hypothetical protein